VTATRQGSSYGTARVRLLDSARASFAEGGYRGATTRGIAERAGVTEAMVFRHFGSKVALFEEAAVAPVIAFMDDYVAEWGTRDHGSTEAVRDVRDFTSRLLEVMAADRPLLIAILAAGQFDDELLPAAERVRDAFGRVTAMFETMIETEFTLRGLEAPDRPAFARVLLGIVIAFSLHGSWLGIGDDDYGIAVARMLDEAARLAVYGVGPAGS
jgi:AcrR family transcriptional regulator